MTNIFDCIDKMRITSMVTIALVQILSGIPGLSSDYILGSGDQISVKIHNIEGFDSTSYILPDGNINLIRINPLLVQGKTLKEAKTSIENAYKTIFKVPVISIELVNPRTPVISIDGAISKPGIYSVSSEQNLLQNWPRVSDALELAGGVKSNADLSSIKLTRFNPNKKTNEELDIDLLSTITSKNPSMNINLLNNDRIYVPTLKNSRSLGASRLNDFSTLSPKQINVLVAGEINSPGRIQMMPNRGVQTAIYTAGGLNSRSSNKILLIRLNEKYFEEQITTETESLQKYQLGSLQNPILREGDIVIVGENFIAKFSDVINTGLSPLRPIIDAAAIFRIFGM